VVRSVLEAAAPAPAEATQTAQARVARLEALLGDPTDPGNPLGYGALLEADRAAVPFAEGEAVLDDFGLNAEFVPRELGGRLDGIDTLVRVMRPVFRRDVGLAMGYGMTTYSRLAARLKELLSTVDAAAAGADDEAQVAGRIDSASDDEMFSFIDRELGV
jgi:hypothetical protein